MLSLICHDHCTLALGQHKRQVFTTQRPLLLLTDGGGQVDGLGAAVDLLVVGTAVAGGVVGGAVEDLAALSRAQGVAVLSERVAELTVIKC